MTDNKKYIFATVIVALVIWMFRWDAVPLNGDYAYYKLDRFTGTSYFCRGVNCIEDE